MTSVLFPRTLTSRATMGDALMYEPSRFVAHCWCSRAAFWGPTVDSHRLSPCRSWPKPHVAQSVLHELNRSIVNRSHTTPHERAFRRSIRSSFVARGTGSFRDAPRTRLAAVRDPNGRFATPLAVADAGRAPGAA